MRLRADLEVLWRRFTTFIHLPWSYLLTTKFRRTRFKLRYHKLDFCKMTCLVEFDGAYREGGEGSPRR